MSMGFQAGIDVDGIQITSVSDNNGLVLVNTAKSKPSLRR